MQTRDSTAEIKFHTGDLFTNRENHQGKTPPGKFKVTTLENPLLSKQTVTSKGIAVPYTNLQLNPYPQYTIRFVMWWQSLISMHSSKYVTNQSMHGSQYVTNTPTWEGCWLQISSIHPHDEDQEAPWLQNLTGWI